MSSSGARKAFFNLFFRSHVPCAFHYLLIRVTLATADDERMTTGNPHRDFSFSRDGEGGGGCKSLGLNAIVVGGN